MEVINAGIRKAIKTMCVVAQTAQFVSLLPKPEDFVTRIVGDVVYLSAQINKLSENMNKLLDSYAEIPGNYLMTQMNSITGSLTSITNRVDTFVENGINQVTDLNNNLNSLATDITDAAIDDAETLSKEITKLGKAVSSVNTAILGETGTAIHAATSEVLEWTQEGFKDVKKISTEPIKKATKAINNAKTKVTDAVGDVTKSINNVLSEPQKQVEKLITELRKKMKTLEEKFDKGFKDAIGMTSVTQLNTIITENLNESDEKIQKALEGISKNIESAVKNFSIAKSILAFGGIMTYSVIVRTGLDQLPPIDFESMLCKIRGELKMTSKDLYKQYNTLTENAYKEYLEFAEEMAEMNEEREYSQKNYKEFLEQFDEELKTQRETIRNLMKGNHDKNGDVIEKDTETLTKRELRSAIKEMQKYRKKIKKAKKTETLKSIVLRELDNFRKEAEYKSNQLKSDWEQMMKQYKKAIAEITKFFKNGGSCDEFINDCCDTINKDFNDIVDLCKNIASQLICCSIKTGMPADVGPVYPNPGYKIADFWMDIKTIFAFIKDIITKVIDIINHINKLVRLMRNGVNNLAEINQQILKMLGLGWLMNLIQGVINSLGDNISSSRERLINTLSPVHFSDTDEYENTLEALDAYLSNETLNEEQLGYLTDTVDLLKDIGNYDKNANKIIEKLNAIKGYGSLSSKESEKIEELIDELDERGELIVAYKSPILQEVGEPATVDGIIDGSENVEDNDIKFIGWHFFHPNLEHTKDTYYKSGILNKPLKKVKSKIIKKAAKNGHKKKGGVNMLKRKKVGTKLTKIDSAYDAFYWYTYYTEDLEKDCFDRTTADSSTIIDNIVRTENGSIVEVTDVNGQKLKVFVADANVRSGDYVTVNGVKYRVK